jgi:uncharacterized membrane protein
MKSKQLFLLRFGAALLTLPPLKTLADPPVTFEVLATFDYPDSATTIANGINDRGDIAGLFEKSLFQTNGFVRFSDGHFSGPIVAPPNPDNYTIASGINNVGTVCGYYAATDGFHHGFLLSQSTFTDIDLTDYDTWAWGVNDLGNFCGQTSYGPFASLGGTVTNFTIPGSVYASANDINNLDQCVGSYDSDGTHLYGFRRDADGTLNYPIGVRGADTLLYGINDHGEMVGLVGDFPEEHGVYFRSPGEYAIYDYPGASYTYFTGINNRGLICGNYVIGSKGSGFIARVRPTTGE